MSNLKEIEIPHLFLGPGPKRFFLSFYLVAILPVSCHVCFTLNFFILSQLRGELRKTSDNVQTVHIRRERQETVYRCMCCLAEAECKLSSLGREEKV